MAQPLSSRITSVLKYYQTAWGKNSPNSSGPKIKVSETLSSVASFYERLRYTIDYKKEHLLRRNAIERILKRTTSAETLIKELIWAKYIKNDFYPLAKVNEINRIVAKYLALAKQFPAGWRDWLLSVASCEIEESLDPALESVDVLAVAIGVWFAEEFAWQQSGLTEEEKENQLAIAVHRSLLRSDEAKSAHFLLRRRCRDWTNESAESLTGKSNEVYQIFLQIKESLANPIQPKLYRFVQRQVAAFQILKSLIEENTQKADQVISDPENFKETIFRICEEKYNEIKDRVNRGIVRSIIYIFITKVLFAIAVEIPYEYYLLGRISVFPLLTTIAVPLFFVFLVGATIKRPDEANTERIIEIISSFVYPRTKDLSAGDHQAVEFSFAQGKRGLRQQVFETFYWVLFFGIFALVTYILKIAGFTFVGIGIFFVFLSLILLFGYRVKFSASELNVTSLKENLASNLLTNVSLPFLDLGVWLADQFAQLNFLIVFFDFLIEAPFKNIIAIVDEWTTYLREKKEEAVETPVER